MAENHFEIDGAKKRIYTSSDNKDFYNLIVDKEKIFAEKHQLYTFAIMVAAFSDVVPGAISKQEQVCQVANIDPDNLAFAKGIVAQLCPDVKNGNDLLERMTEYAEAGIAILRVEYENNGTLRLDSYIE